MAACPAEENGPGENAPERETEMQPGRDRIVKVHNPLTQPLRRATLGHRPLAPLPHALRQL